MEEMNDSTCVEYNITEEESQSCYICDSSYSSSMKSLVLSRTEHSDTSFPEKLGKLMGDTFTVILTTADVICTNCSYLLNSMDKLEIDLNSIRKTLWTYIVLKYNLTDIDFEESPALDLDLIKEAVKESEENSKRKHFIKSNYTYSKNKKMKKSDIRKADIVDFNNTNSVEIEDLEPLIEIEDSKQEPKDFSSSKRFFCEECTNSFLNINDFRNHLKQHKIFSCRYCRHPFSNYTKLKTHLLICESAQKETSPLLSGSAERYKCEHCNIVFLYAQSYKRHIDLNHSDNKTKNKENGEIIEQENQPKESQVKQLNIESLHIDQQTFESSNVLPEIEIAKISNQTEDNLETIFHELGDDEKSDFGETYFSNMKSECLGKSNDKDKLNYIAKSAELKRIYECQFCKYKTSIDSEMKEHIGIHDKKKLHCEICNVNFSKRSNYCKHISKHNLSSTPSKCSACGVECKDELHLKMHMVSLHPGQPTCTLCSEKFISIRALHTHRKNNHPKEYDYNCAICNKSFTREAILRNHVEYEHREERKCKVCGKEIDDIKRLRWHEQRHMREEQHNWECEHCDKKFKTKTGLKFHTAQHTGDYKLFCEICGRGFMSSVILKEHMGVHTREERYVCDVCGQKFCFNATYRVHRMWHDNPLPYQCKICNQKFSHTSLLAVHRRRIHTLEKPYSCKFCDLSFTCSSSLKRHERVHTGERPHVCQWCNRGFVEKKAWAKHLAIEHADFTEINKKRTCEYKMVIKPDMKDALEINESSEIIDEDSNADANKRSIITIHNPDGDTNGESMLIYDTTTLVGDGSNEAIEVAIARGYQIIKSEDSTETLLEGLEENSFVLETVDGHRMVIHGGNFVALKN